MPPEAAVATPAVDTQAANPAADTQAIITTPVDGGTDGTQPPNDGATVQTTPDSGEPPVPATPVVPDAPTYTPEQLLEIAEQRVEARKAAQAEAQAAKEAREKTLSELRDLRRNVPKTVRNALDTIAEQANIVIPVELRSLIEDNIENLSLKGVDAAKIEFGEEGAQALLSEQQSFIDACYAAIDPARRAEFTAEVNEKGHDDWVKAAAKYAPRPDGMVTNDDLVSQVGAIAKDAKYNLSPAEQNALTEALKGAKTPAATLVAVFNAGILREKTAPGAAPASDGMRNAPQDYTYAQVSKMNAAQLAALPPGTLEKVGLVRS